MQVMTSYSTQEISPRRAIGIIRVSEVGGRDGDSFTSPEVQAERIQDACERDGLELVELLQELDVSGGKPLDQRPGLSQAVAAIEAGKAEVIAAAYFDRLFRSLSTQAEVVERVERVGGKVLAVDVGQVTHGSASEWLSATMLGAVAEHMRRSVGERTAAGQKRAVERGAVPWARIPLGYKRSEAGPLEIDPETSPLAIRAFEMRAEGQSAKSIMVWLAEHGIKRSHGGVTKMLASRVYLGEINYGEMHNLNAHEPLIDRDLWQRVNRMVIPRGPQAPSDRLLARLRILRCGSCGNPLGTMKLPKQNNLPIYRCSSNNVCDCHVTINAETAEQVVSDVVRKAISNATGRAQARENAQAVVAKRDGAQAALDGALRSFAATGLDHEPAAVDRLAELRQARDEAQVEVDRLGPDAVKAIALGEDWDRLSLDGKRALIQATVERAVVAPAGHRRRWDGGPDRITVHLLGE